VVRSRGEHSVSRRDIDPAALKVLYRLSECGHNAYLVGGGVRDLLLGRHPKDFDVGTDAHPKEIKRLFRNCFLIGRRFRLAHIRFGEKVIETSTFRRDPISEDGAEDGADLLQHRDNTFGSPEEDARRRDFTINGLFYDIKTFQVLDYVGGLRDLDARLIRAIGDPSVRFREDPVRMLRAVRFASRLGFAIEPATRAAILAHHGDILRSTKPRLFEEILRLFAFGSSDPAFRLLRELGLLGDLFPELDAWFAGDPAGGCGAWSCLAALDRRLQEAGDLPAPEKLAALFAVPYLSRAAGEGGDSWAAAQEVLQPAVERFGWPRRVSQETTDVLGWLPVIARETPRIPRRGTWRHQGLLRALDFYDIAAAAGCLEAAPGIGWRQAVDRDHGGGDDGVAEPDAGGHPQASSRRPRRRGGRGRRGRARRPQGGDARRPGDAAPGARQHAQPGS
jgi:poly(A) polymerase